FGLADKAANLRHATFDSVHAYNQPMREAMYGWMTKHLKGEGDGKPIPEPAFKTEDPEVLRCFPGDLRPDDYMTIPRFAARESRALLAKKSMPTTKDELTSDLENRRSALVEKVLGGFPNVKPKMGEFEKQDGANVAVIEPEPGLHLRFASRLD